MAVHKLVRLPEPHKSNLPIHCCRWSRFVPVTQWYKWNCGRFLLTAETPLDFLSHLQLCAICVQPLSDSSNCSIRCFPPAIGTFVYLDTGRSQAQVFHVRSWRQRTKHSFQSTIVPPFRKTGIHRLPGVVNSWQLPPLCAAWSDPDHLIKYISIIFPWTASFSHPFGYLDVSLKYLSELPVPVAAEWETKAAE